MWRSSNMSCSRNMTCYLMIPQRMRGNVRQVSLSAMNHQMFRDLIMCLHGSMKDGLQENTRKASYISSFAGEFVVLVAKRGDRRKKLKREQ